MLTELMANLQGHLERDGDIPVLIQTERDGPSAIQGVEPARMFDGTACVVAWVSREVS